MLLTIRHHVEIQPMHLMTCRLNMHDNMQR
jgi:hypothetical protein